mmetsp:Transcript_68658/g.200944  ORF Transcript_68658/g.200944 Transcript_68658/m.200944 type:complete len:428 (-) Transcript_68658:236-1519(-)
MSHATVVLLGDVGMGKSTLVEKVTGIRGISSAASTSVTLSSHAYITRCGRLQLIDTPGSNAMESKLEHNVWIAHALNLDPVSLILLVVKAEQRIDNTVDAVRKYAEVFVQFLDILDVVITHMDLVGWEPAEAKKHLEQELGIDEAVFVGISTPGDAVLHNVILSCKKRTPQNLTIDSENFLKFFRISDSNMKIVRSVKDQVDRFRVINDSFMRQLRCRGGQEQIDMVFEFQQWMQQEIVEAQKRVADSNDFTFMGHGSANEAGHIANMTNQLRAVLFEVRTMAAGFQAIAGVSDLRKCPYCGAVWAKLEGCDGDTTCGNRMNRHDGRFSSLLRFTFQFDGTTLRVSNTHSQALAAPKTGSGAGAGCGRTIAWRAMAPVTAPPEFYETKAVTTDDVHVLPETARPFWKRTYQSVEQKLGKIPKTLVGS